jgi:hypothetical protein
MKRTSKRLQAHFAKLRSKAKLKRVRQGFKPTKKERDSFVFVDTRGKRRPVDSRATGFLFYVNRKGEVRRVTQGKGDVSSHRYRDFDLTRSRRATARKKWLKSWDFVTFGKPTSIQSRESITLETIGRKMNPLLSKYIGRYGMSNLMVAELAITVNGKIHRTSFLITGAQLRSWNQGKGNRGFLKNLVWKAVSTELALNDLVAKTSAEFIKRLKHNRKKSKSKWTDARGQVWGKASYKTAKIQKIEVRFKVATKKRLK